MTDLIKSTFADPRFNNRGFVKHIHHRTVDCGVVPGTTVPLTEAYQILMIENLKASSGTGGKPRNLALFRKVLEADPALGVWQFLHMWEELQDYDEASCAGSVDVLLDGTVHVSLAFGKKNPQGAMQYQSWEASIPRSEFAQPIVRLAGSSVLFDPIRTHPDWQERQLTGGVLVNVPAVFNVPPKPIYKVRLVIRAGAVNTRARAGSQQSPFFVTANTQVPNIQMHQIGEVPGPNVWVSCVDGDGRDATASVWFQITGAEG